MNRYIWIAAAAGLALGCAAPTIGHAKDIKKLETKDNLEDLGKLLGAKATVIFTSDPAGDHEEKEADDVLKAFGQIITSEGGIAYDANFDAQSAVLQDRVLYYDDEDMTVLSDGVARYLDKNGREAFAFQSDGFQGIPEPTTWALMVLGFAGLGVMARRRRAAGGVITT